MKVYVESGFVVTLALRQGEYEAAEQLLRLAEAGRIVLAIPSFSLSEPFATMQNRGNARRRLIDELRREIRELGRTRPHERMARELEQYAIQMDQVLQTSLDALESVVLETSQVCELLQLNAGVVTRAVSYKTGFDLQMPDAIILANIILDLEREQRSGGALFISQNVKDFGVPAIQDALQDLGCKYLADFANAVRYITRPSDEMQRP